jgi:N-ethylmaleimide reductase
MDELWEPVNVGALTLPNRVAMAPMTRSRATPEGVPTPLSARYYAQRASCGLIISEGTHHRCGTRGGRPHFHSTHARRAHRASFQLPARRLRRGAVGRSCAWTDVHAGGYAGYARAARAGVAEIASTIRAFRHAAACAIEAGADGVEIHAANGYLIRQFLSENANRRSDARLGQPPQRAADQR